MAHWMAILTETFHSDEGESTFVTTEIFEVDEESELKFKVAEYLMSRKSNCAAFNNLPDLQLSTRRIDDADIDTLFKYLQVGAPDGEELH